MATPYRSYQNNNLNGNAVTVTKKLTFIGFGYMLDKNPGLQATAVADYYVSLYFNPGSDGSSAQGRQLILYLYSCQQYHHLPMQDHVFDLPGL